MDLETLNAQIRTLPHVTQTNYWAKGGHERLYVQVDSQNRFPNAATIYVDLTTQQVVATLTKGKSGAQSYAWSQDVAQALTQLVQSA